MEIPRGEHQTPTELHLRLVRTFPRVTGAVVAAAVLVVTVLILLGWVFAGARPLTVADAGARWVPGASDGLPYRPPAGVASRPLRDWSLTPPGRTQVSHDFEVSPDDPEALSLLLLAANGSVNVFLNGVPIAQTPPEAERYLSLPGARPSVWAIPANTVRPGLNRLSVIVNGAPHRALEAPLLLGPQGAPEQLHAVLIRLSEAMKRGLASLAVAAALLALIAAAVLRSAAPWIAVSAAAAAIGARTAVSDADVSPLFAPLGSVLDPAFVCAAAICLGCAIRGVDRRPSPRADRIAAAVCGVIILLLGLALYDAWRRTGGLDAAALGLPLLGMAFLVWTATTALRPASLATFSVRLQQGFVLGLILLVSGSAVLNATGLAWGLWVLGLDAAYGVGALVLLAGLAVTAAFLTVRQIVRWVRDRPGLRRVIQSQQLEIAAAALALRQQEQRAAVLEERQRVARDMHDGIGGQLMSLLARVRSQRISPGQMEDELTSGLAELRLMMDSLDASDGPVADALSVLRTRIRSQAEAANMALDWNQDEALDGVTADPQWMLNLNRLIQEAVTNAARHSGGDRLGVALELADAVLTVTVRDNGKGFDREAVKPGRGLINLVYRAGQLGGAIEMGRDPHGAGSRIIATVPLPTGSITVPTAPQS